MSVDSPGIRVGRGSLALRLGVAFVTLTTVTVIVVGAALILTSRRALQDKVFDQQQRSAREVALAISSYLENNLDDLSLVVRMQNLTAMEETEIEQTLESLLAARSTRLASLTLMDTTGQERVKVSQFHAYLPGELQSQYQTDMFTRAARGETFISPIYIAPDSGLLTIQIAIPLQTATGQTMGVLAAEVIVTRLWQEVARIEVGETGYTYIVDKAGSFVAHQEPTQVLQRYGEDMKHIPLVAGFVAGNMGVETAEYRGLNGQQVVGSLVPIAGTDWAAVVEMNTSEAYAAVERMQWLLVGLVVFGVTVAAGIGYAVTRQTIQPISGLTLGAEQVAAGNLDVEIDVPDRSDEIGVLTAAFQKMLTELRALYANLEQQVAERTAELSQQAQELEASNQLNARRAAQLAAAAQVARAVASTLDPDQLLEQVVHLIAEQFGYYHAGIFLLDENGEWAVLRAANSEGGKRMLARGHRLAVGRQGIVGETTFTGQPHIALDVGEDALYFDNPDLPETRSEIALPLIARGEIIGALDVQSKRPGAFDEQDIHILGTLADQIATALDNARLFRASQNALEQLRTIQRQYAQAGWQEYTATTGASYVEYRREEAGSSGDDGPPPTLEIPITLRGAVIGKLGLQSDRPDRQWSADEIALAHAVADQIGQAMEAARLLHDTRRLAQREQLVAQIADRIRAAPTIDRMLQVAVQETRRILGATYGVVRLGTETHLCRPDSEGPAAERDNGVEPPADARSGDGSHE